MGISSSDLLEDGRFRVKLIEKLPYRRWNVAIFGHAEAGVSCVSQIPKGSRILTEYPRLTRLYLKMYHPTPHQVYIFACHGASEGLVKARRYGFGAGVVATGQTLQDTGLVEVDFLWEGVPVLIGKPGVVDEHWQAVKEFFTCGLEAHRGTA